ncbi:HD domain-containing protein [Patescibacteria group bacterium]|nr:HD domain-containing protein [Patescibacteria group bacterium]
MNSFEDYRVLFRNMYVAVKEGHEKSPMKHRGHGMDHDVTVAQIATLIAPDDRAKKLGWVAGMLHSTDRVVPADQLTVALTSYLHALPEGYFTNEEKQKIVEAVLRHSELNQDNQSDVQQLLMDADRLANLTVALFIRGGQFRPDIPAFEFTYLNGTQNPASTYKYPKSVLDNIRADLEEYLPQLRLPAAKELGTTYAERLSQIIAWIEKDYHDLSLAGLQL